MAPFARISWCCFVRSNVVAGALVLLAFALPTSAGSQEADKPKELGRYELVAVPVAADRDTLILFDTATGQAWTKAAESLKPAQWESLGVPIKWDRGAKAIPQRFKLTVAKSSAKGRFILTIIDSTSGHTWDWNQYRGQTPIAEEIAMWRESAPPK